MSKEELAERAGFYDVCDGYTYACNERTAFLSGYAAAEEQAKAEIERLKEALNSVISKSHSWVICEETARIEMPIHESCRKLAQKALAGGGKGES